MRRLASAIGVTKSYVHLIEADGCPPPTPELLSKLAKALGADRDELHRLAGRIPTEVERVLLSVPGSFARVRRMKKIKRAASS